MGHTIAVPDPEATEPSELLLRAASGCPIHTPLNDGVAENYRISSLLL